MIITVNVFRIWDGRTIEVAIPRESYPVLETEWVRRWTDKVFPCYDINNRYMGYMDSGIFHNMREGWYCVFCSFETGSFWRAVVHDIKHLFCVRKRKTNQTMKYIFNLLMYLPLITGVFFIMIAPKIAIVRMCRARRGGTGNGRRNSNDR